MLNMQHSVKVGFSFGSTSGIITTLGLMVGLHSGTGSLSAVIGGILTIAVADAFSDALGIHISEEAENIHTSRQIWESTISTFLFKFLFSSIFILPLLFLPLSTAVVSSVLIGALLLAVFSYLNARQGPEPHKAVMEHLFIMAMVISITHYLGNWIAATFGV